MVGWKQQQVVPLHCDVSPQGQLQVLSSLFVPSHSFVCNRCCLPVLIFSFSFCYVSDGTTKQVGQLGCLAQVY